MPEKQTIERAKKAKREGKAPSTQAGEFVREEFEHIREGKHGARSAKQAIAIGLSKARRAGVKLPPPKKGKTSEKARRSAERDYRRGRRISTSPPNPTRSRATMTALKHEGKQAASHEAISRQAKRAARELTPSERSARSRKAARSRSAEERSESAHKAARTRARKHANG